MASEEKVTWTRTMNLDLVKYMEDKPNIWDPNHPKFTNLGLRDEIFAEFASDHNVDWQAVKTRWTNIRSTFGFYMRKLHARKESGKDFKVGWFLWKPCKYLYKVHRLKSLEKSNGKEKDLEKTSKKDEHVEDDDMSNDAGFSDSSQSQDIKENGTSCQAIAKSLSTVLEGVQDDAYNIKRSKYAAIGDAVTNMLSQLNSYEAAQMTQKIIEILAEYDEENPMNPNGLRYLTDLA